MQPNIIKKYSTVNHIFLLVTIILNSNYCQKIPENIYSEVFLTSPATKAQNYSKENEWQDRVFSIRKDQIEFVKSLNKIDGFDEVPVETKQIRKLQERMKNIQSRLPAKLNSLLNKFIYGIYFCENLGGTGIFGIVYEEEKPKGGFIVIDANMIEKSANDWITAKENTAFNSKKLKLRIEIEDSDANNPENALRYIFLHEFGHIISVVKEIAPDFREKRRDFASFPFFRNNWKNENSSLTDDSIFRKRPELKFYSDKKINLDQNWEQVYKDLAHTSFPTLYSATNPDDHFAESFVSFVHCVLEKKKWELNLSENKKEVFSMKNGIVEERSGKERIFMENLFQEN